MSPIRSQPGYIEESLATRGEQLPEPSKKLLQKTAEAAFAQASIPKRAGWWLKANTGLAIAGGLVIGLIAGVVVRTLFAKDRR